VARGTRIELQTCPGLNEPSHKLLLCPSCRKAQSMHVDQLSRVGPREYHIRFGLGQDGNQYLGSGWCEPEDGFVWSAGDSAEILLPAVGPMARLSVGLWGYVPPKAGPQKLLIFANGLLLSILSVTEKVLLSYTVPVASPNDRFRLTFYLPSAISPAAVGQGTDERRLGIALASLIIQGTV